MADVATTPPPPGIVPVVWQLRYLDLTQASHDDLCFMEAVLSSMAMGCAQRGQVAPAWLDPRYMEIVAALKNHEGV